MPQIKGFEDLQCWQKSRELARCVYRISSKGALAKDFDMKSQLRRAAISCMNNIAEGFSKYIRKDLVRFLDFTTGSAGEVKSMSYLLIDLGYIVQDEFLELQTLSNDTRNLSLGLIRYIIKSSKT